MSQVRRHGQGTDHYPYFQPPPQAPLPPPPLSPAAVRSSTTTTTPTTTSSATPSSPALTGGLIPRDYLGPRPDQQQHALRSAPATAPATAAPRKLSPSPLQTSVRSLSPRADESGSSQSPLSPSSSASTPPFQNRSPVGHIAHAAFPTPPSSTGHSLSNQPETTTGRKPFGAHHHYEREMTDEKVNPTKSRKPSDTTDSNQSSTSSPISVVSSLQSMAGERSGQRAMPRTSSIDSAISSLSSASQSHRSTFDANAVSQADIGNLISTAGSPEAVIIHLLKEKHHAASQNSQLWRLVDKQRTLVLGLNKDLERALKEKEKYKKKVKDLQNSGPSAPSDRKSVV